MDLDPKHQIDQSAKSEKRFRRIFESAKMGIAFSNQQGIILECNQAFQDLLGYSEKELASIADVKSVSVLDRIGDRTTFRVHASTATDLCPAIYDLARQHDWALTELKRDVRTLEAVFNELTAGQGGAQ